MRFPNGAPNTRIVDNGTFLSNDELLPGVYGMDHEAAMPMARGYYRSEQAVQPAQRLHILHAGGGLLGSVGDLAKWASALHQGQVLNPTLYEAMTTSTALPSGQTLPYVFGLELEEVRGRKGIGHGARVIGFVGDSIYIPSEDLFVAILANSTPPPAGASGIVKRLAALAMNEPFVVLSRAEVDFETLAPLFGVYEIGKGGKTRLFFSRDGKLFTVLEGGDPTEVIPAGGDRFFYGPQSLTWFRVERRSDGSHVMEMHQNGDLEAERAVRKADVPDAVIRSKAPAV